jgi:Flp pilus assembly protein TadD
MTGMIERQAGHVDAALAAFDKASEVAPTNVLPIILKGMTLEQKGDVKAAAAAYRQALKIAPEDNRAKRLLAGLDD